MAIQEEIGKLIGHLVKSELVKVRVGGSDIDARLLNDSAKISLISSVYEGDAFIPKSVRKSIAGRPPFGNRPIYTNLVVDEDHYQIFLSYLGVVNSMDRDALSDLLEEFSWQADEWRLFLEEHGKNDLLYVHVKN